MKQPDGLQTASGGKLMWSIGFAKGCLGDKEGALATFEEGLQILRGANLIDTLEGASLLQARGSALAHKGDKDAAFRSYAEAQKALESLGLSLTGCPPEPRVRRLWARGKLCPPPRWLTLC